MPWGKTEKGGEKKTSGWSGDRDFGRERFVVGVRKTARAQVKSAVDVMD